MDLEEAVQMTYSYVDTNAPNHSITFVTVSYGFQIHYRTHSSKVQQPQLSYQKSQIHQSKFLSQNKIAET